MPDSSHLKRLAVVWPEHPLYFVTVCLNERRNFLAAPATHLILREEFAGLRPRHGWSVGRYVVMPDHVHFFVAPSPATAKTLSEAVGRWKEWTAKRIVRLQDATAPLWQPAFFDHVLRSDESRSEKWRYVRENPVRAGLVARCEDWPYAGSVDFE